MLKLQTLFFYFHVPDDESFFSPHISDDIVERYDNLSKSVSNRNEKIQITLTRSMSVQDGLDEMMGWMERVEATVKENRQIPLDSVSIAEALSKETVRCIVVLCCVGFSFLK